MFGGKNTRIQGGKFIKATGGPLPSTPDGTSTNRPTNDVWLALAPIFGVTCRRWAPRRSSPGRYPGWSPERTLQSSSSLSAVNEANVASVATANEEIYK